MKEFHVLSLGAGVQSTMLALLSARENLPQVPRFDCAIFADTQEEPAAVYSHVEWLIATLPFPVLVRSAGKLGEHLVSGTNSTGGRFASIPAYTGTDRETGGKVPRQCTKEYKTEVVERAIRRDVVGLKPGQRIPADVVVHQYLGLSYDEPGRIYGRGDKPGAKARIEAHKWARAHFPLYDLYITRAMCVAWLAKQGIPHEVPRSACVCCPFRADDEWIEMRDHAPLDFARAVEIDADLRLPGAVVNRNLDEPLFLHESRVPLSEVQFVPSPPRSTSQTDINFSAFECEGLCGL